MNETVELIAGAVSSKRVDEIGVVFEDTDSVILVEDKLGLSPKLLRQLHQHFKTLPKDTPHRSLIRVICNGDDYTSWSTRKAEVLRLQPLIPALEEELHLTTLILSKQPKSHGAWEHRHFIAELLVRKYASDAEGAGEELQTFLTREVDLCMRVCLRHARTYHAWKHRAWACSWMDAAALRAEHARVKEWLGRNNADASAAHHYSVVYRLLADRDVGLVLRAWERVSLLVHDLQWAASQLIQGDAIWRMRRYIAHQLLWEMEQSKSLNPSAWRSIEFNAKLALHARFQSYEWVLLQQAVDLNVNGEALLQILYDECAAAAASKELGGNASALVWLSNELCALHERIHHSDASFSTLLPTRFANQVLVVPNCEEELLLALLVFKLVFSIKSWQRDAGDVADAFARAKQFGAMLARFDSVEFPAHSFLSTSTYRAPEDALDAFIAWLDQVRNEREWAQKRNAPAFYQAMLARTAPASD